MYEVADDTYCYPGTSILKNKINTRRPDVLKEFEAEMTSLRSAEPMPAGGLDYAHYKAIHRHLFQDIYRWAGKPRTVRISKGGNMFCFPEHIDAEANKLFASLRRKKHLRGLGAQEFATEAAHFLAELNAIHAFREGNGRVQLSFLVLLAERAKYSIDLTKTDPERVMSVMIDSFSTSEQPLAALIAELVAA